MKKILVLCMLFILSLSMVSAGIVKTLLVYDPMGYGSSGTTINSTLWNNTAGCTQISANQGYLECNTGNWIKSFPLDTNFGLDTTDYFQIEFHARALGADDGVLLMDEEPAKVAACAAGGQRGYETTPGDCQSLSRFGALKIDDDNNNLQVMLPGEAGLQAADISFWSGTRWWTYIYNSSGYFIRVTNFNSPGPDTYPTVYQNSMGSSAASPGPTNPLNYIGMGDWDSTNPNYGFIQISRFTVYHTTRSCQEGNWGDCDITNNLTLNGTGSLDITGDWFVLTNDRTIDCNGRTLSGGQVNVQADDIVFNNCTFGLPLIVTGSGITHIDSEVGYANVSEFTDIETTDLLLVEDISDIDLVLATTQGKIDWVANVDLSSNADLDDYIEISHNVIAVDTTNAPNLDTSATLTMKDTGYTTVNTFLVKKDGEVCDDCTNIDIADDDVSFDVTGFSTYSLITVGIDISQENYVSMRTNLLYILAAFATVIIIIGATVILTFVFSGGKFDLITIAAGVLALAVGFAVLLAVFVNIINLFGVG